MITIQPLFEPQTSTFTYIVFDAASKDAVVIDPVLDFDPVTLSISFTSIDRVMDFLARNRLKTQLILDTHAHADHMTGAHILATRLQTKSAISQNFAAVQRHFASLYGLEDQALATAYDYYFGDHEELQAGSLTIKVLLTPGHTPSCAAFLIEDALFCGDALFQPELGAGRADFPGGSAQCLYRSITQRIYRLPPTTRIFVGHDYPTGPNEPRYATTVKASQENNVLIGLKTNEQSFIAERERRDKTLALPKLLFFAMQINIRGGRLPPKDEQGRRFLQLPLTISGQEH